MVQPAPRTPDVLADPVRDAVSRGLERLAALQEPDGAWRGDYGGPMFLLPMYVGAHHIARREIPAATRRRMVEYIEAVQREDGSVGLHAEAERPCMFTSVLCYVALRLLGQHRDDEAAAAMRRWILESGGALGSSSWGKFMLCLLNLYDYEGLHPVLPELWLLPYRAPVHPGRLWCHCRQVYLPMAWLYGVRAAAPEDRLLLQIRQEIYDQPYHTIRWREHRDTLSEHDRRLPASPLLSLVNRALGVADDLHIPLLRARALAALREHIDYEDEATHFIRIGPVNAVLNTLVHCFAAPGSEAVERSFTALEGYLYDGHDGVKMNGYNSTALWDTAFGVQTVLAAQEAGVAQTPALKRCLERAGGFIRDNQVVDDLPERERFFRHACVGGWPFSDRPHGWPITDCTAEGLKSALGLQGRLEPAIPDALLRQTVELILSFQNQGGGWSTYELQRGGSWLERLNPSGVFSEIMVDYPYVECTSASIQALVRARGRYGAAIDARIHRAVARGARFIRRQQREDGGFYGSWAVCFTYGTWFAVWGLAAAGADPDNPGLRRACAFLERHQSADGGWGEHHDSCTEQRYVPHPESQVVNTAWALLALIRAGRGRAEAARRAARFLVARQLPDGDWPREAMVGVFNKTTLINYDNYRRYFPVWALSCYLV